ncbi:MAG: hypothetical protein ACR2KZ_05630, partial [Segetibacter sp.]
TILFAHAGRTLQNDTSANSGLIRIVFSKKVPHSYFKAKYGVNDLSKETSLTLNNFIDIPKLQFGETYQFVVVGVNGAGEGEPSEIKKIKVEPGLAPPLIYYTEAANNGFYVGYATANDDYQFIIQYTDKPGSYDNATTIQTGAKGVLFVPGVSNGKKYYFRMKKIKDNNYATDWSEEHTVIPDGGQLPASPEIHGALQNGNGAIPSFQPVKKATGYVAQYRKSGSNEWMTKQVHAAQISVVKIAGLLINEKYKFRMATLNETGQSEFSEVVEAK